MSVGPLARRSAAALTLMLGWGVHAQESAPALTLGYSADPEGFRAPARVGYSSADGKGGAQLRLALRYALPPARIAGDVQVEPFAGLVVADERARKLDNKEVQAGARLIFGEYGYADAAIVGGADRRTGAKHDGARIGAVVLAESLSGSMQALKLRGLYVRPKAGLYVERQRHTDDPVAAPDGRASGVWAGLDVRYEPLASPRHTVGYRNRFVRDVSVSDDRARERHRFHAFRYTRLFYDPNDTPVPGKPRISLTIERAIGSDPIDGSRERHATTGVYLGFQL